MAVFQTDGEPPSNGSTIFENMGWMEKINNAERKIVAVKTGSVKKDRFFCGRAAKVCMTSHFKNNTESNLKPSQKATAVGSKILKIR
jgi:hypothetical protein